MKKLSLRKEQLRLLSAPEAAAVLGGDAGERLVACTGKLSGCGAAPNRDTLA